MRCLLVCALSLLLQVSRTSMSQSPPVLTVRVGDRAVLNCSQNVSVYRGASINWFKQSGRGRLQFVYKTAKFMPPEGRFSGILDQDLGNYALVIENVQQNDAGIYVCAGQHDRGFGNGSKLVVTAGSTTIFLLAPPPGEIPQIQPVPLVCVVRGASSDSVQITWNVSGNVSKGLVDPGTFDPDGSYSVRSRFQISAERWRSGAVCTCVAGDLISHGVAAQKVSDGLWSSVCPLMLFAGLVPTLLLLILGGSALAVWGIIENRRAGKSKTAGGGIRSWRGNPQHDIYAQLRINTN